MRLTTVTILAAFASCAAVPAWAGDDAETAVVAPEVRAYLAQHCGRCHGPKEQNAEVRFDTMPTAIADETAALRWQDVLDVLNLGQMPPEGEPRPPREETSNAIETLTANLLEARRRLTDTGGHVVIRRLNRRQYRNTIDALFGLPVDTSLLPEDAVVDGFDTLGQAQSFSSLHLERYLSLGRDVLDRAYDFKTLSRAQPYEHVEQSEGQARHELEKHRPGLVKKIEQYDKSIAEGKKSHEDRREVTRLELKLTDDYLARPETETGALVPFCGLVPYAWNAIRGGHPTGRYVVSVRCGVAADEPVDDYFMKVVRGEFRSKVPDAIDYYQITGTFAEPQTIEFEIEIDDLRSNRLQFSRRNGRIDRLEKYAEIRDYIFKYPEVAWHADDERPDLWIDSIEMSGPLPEPDRPLSAAVLFEGREPKDLDEAGARTIIERFAFEAFRHQPPEPEYVDRLVAIYSRSRDRGAAPIEALKDALVVVLATPRFLFLDEPKLDDAPRRDLTDRELAVRLAYFLWSAPPDAELYAVAAEGQLQEPAVLAAQVDRLLDDPRSETFVETFTSQWLDLDHLDRIDPEATPARSYDDAVHRLSRRQVAELFDTLLDENLPATHLIDADYAVVNALLAEFYGLEGVVGDEFRRVPLAADSPRGGLLGQSAILTLTGNGLRTSPVDRGAYALRKLLHRPPPPAPANVPMLDEETVGERSIRDTLAMHQANPQCASCHRRIDPLGFALENFDPVGLWRTEVPSASGDTRFPVDARGVMPDGRALEGPIQLKQRLLEDREPFLAGLTEALTTYAVGRSMGFSDREAIDRIVTTTATEHDNRLRALLHEIVRSDAFTKR